MNHITANNNKIADIFDFIRYLMLYLRTHYIPTIVATVAYYGMLFFLYILCLRQFAEKHGGNVQWLNQSVLGMTIIVVLFIAYLILGVIFVLADIYHEYKLDKLANYPRQGGRN